VSIGYLPCLGCKHFDRQTGWTCAAFPDGIPEAVLQFRNDHTAPFPGDNGIRFEPSEDLGDAERLLAAGASDPAAR
jgi:hypothetical protein